MRTLYKSLTNRSSNGLLLVWAALLIMTSALPQIQQAKAQPLGSSAQVFEEPRPFPWLSPSIEIDPATIAQNEGLLITPMLNDC